ncbi:MAG: hypothetical protein ACOZNI_30180 [Myxococcota bacterium]
MRTGSGATCALLWLLTACVDDVEKTNRPAGREQDPGPTPAPPTITLVSPSDGAGSYGNLAVTWDVDGFGLEEPGAGTAAADHGHVHVYLDGALVLETGTESAALSDLPAGDHTLEVRLSKGDEQELDVRDEVAFTVLRPGVTLTAPATAPIGSWVQLPVVVSDFTLGSTPGSAATFGDGYYTVRVDGAPWAWGADPAQVGVGHLPEGPHVIQVELVDGAGQPLDPPVVSEEVTVAIPAGEPFVSFDHALFAGPWDSAEVPVAITVANFDLRDGGEGDVPPTDTGAAPDDFSSRGWYHLYLDGVWYESSAALTHDLMHLAPGWHVLDLVLVDARSGWEMPVRDVLRVQVAPDRPDLLVTDPGDEYGVHGTFDLTVATENFTLSPAGGEPAEDVGQYAVYVDGVLTTTTGAPTTAIGPLADGPHTVKVVLTGNDGVELSPAVWDQITVNVDSTLP